MAVTVDHVIYVIGGLGESPQALWAYDPEHGQWVTDLSPLPEPREHLAAAVLNGSIYVIGGRWHEGGNLATVDVYDPTSDTWSGAPSMSMARSGFTVGAFAGQLHVTGGEALSTGETFASHEVLEADADAWVTLEPMPTPRHGLASGVVDGRWYLIGGATGAGARTLATLTDVVQVYAPQE